THAKVFDYVCSPNGGTNDYDIAMRLTQLAYGNNNIFVTGSTNAVIDSMHILHTSNPFYHSGIMSLELDAGNLSVAGGGTHNKPFSIGYDGYGVGLAQKYISSTGNYYNLVIGNRFLP